MSRSAHVLQVRTREVRTLHGALCFFGVTNRDLFLPTRTAGVVVAAVVRQEGCPPRCSRDAVGTHWTLHMDRVLAPYISTFCCCLSTLGMKAAVALDMAMRKKASKIKLKVVRAWRLQQPGCVHWRDDKH